MHDPRGEDPTIAAGPATSRSEAGGGELEPRARVADRWEIVALLGTGGMGNVYRAVDHELGEEVALKVLRRIGSDDELARFRREVKLARRITHVNVARTHDIGHHGPGLFLTMELIDGESLSHRMSRGLLSWREATAIARAVCAGVGAAHAAGVIHRDLKPDNVMLAADGRAVVTDFGIAEVHAVEGSAGTLEVTGTPAWMAPEQLLGDADGRADVYAIGELLHAMLAGAHPWLRDGKIDVMARLSQPPPRLSPSTVPDALAAVVERALQRDPAARWPDAAALGQALAAAEEAILTGTTPPRAAAVRAARRDVRIGVRAIRNLGPPDDAYIADGLVEDLIDMLGRAGGLRVRSVGAEPALDLDVVVDGSLRRVGDDVRITVRALGAQDGFQIWGQRFDRRLDEILRVSDEVAREVAAALSATAAHAAAGRDVTTDRVVVELYLRARQLIEGGWWDDPRTLGFLKAALEHAPDSPVVLAAYAAQLGRRINAAEDEAARLVVEAEASVMARRAIAHGPDLGEPWVALAVVFYNHGHEVPAVKAARLALDRAPGLADASDVAGRILLELDPRVNDAVSLLERARWSNPRLPSNLIDLSRGYSLRGDWSLVDELMRVPGTESAAARAIAAARLALWRGGDMPAWPDRVVGFERINWSAYASMAVIRDGRFTAEVAAEWRRRLELMAPGRRARRFFAQLGCEVALRVEAHDVAWQMLDAAVDNGLIDLAWMDRMPLLAPLRDEPRFVAHRAVVAARATPPLEAWHAALPEPDPDAWLAEEAARR